MTSKDDCAVCAKRRMMYLGTLPEGARVLSSAVGMMAHDGSTYVLWATDQGAFMTHNGLTRKLEPTKGDV